MNEFQIKEKFVELRHQLTSDVIDQSEAIAAFDNLRDAYNNLSTNPTFKFNIGQKVWLLKNDKVHEGTVRVRRITESIEKLDSEKEYFRRNTQSKLSIIYSLRSFNDIDANWQLDESQLFASKQELLESL